VSRSRAVPLASARSGTGITLLALSLFLAAGAGAAEPGITDTAIRLGGVMDLEGRSRGLGQGMRAGIEAALAGAQVHGRTVEFVARNDSYTPEKTVAATRRLVEQGVFAMLGNVGTPTAKVSLPILAERRIPAVGFFTGAGLLRPGEGDIVNFRASYVQETEAVIRSAINAGVPPAQICAFVQNDAYGMAGVTGIRRALLQQPGTEAVVKRIDMLLAQPGEDPPRNGLAPVGVYRRNTFVSKPGYDSLKSWEAERGEPCRVVVTVGTYAAVARFAGYARYKGERWIISAVSFTGAANLRESLAEVKIDRGVIMTQVVPRLDSSIPIVVQARSALGERFGHVSLEGFIVGKLWLRAMEQAGPDISRQGALTALLGRRFDLGGLPMDFTDDNQGSDLVILTLLTPDGFRSMGAAGWRGLLRP
jgi:ABC-type branched-subunit amino acid transport system substrate-binding protein